MKIKKRNVFKPSFQYNGLEIHKTQAPRQKPSETHQLVFGKQMADHMLVAEWTTKHGWQAPSIVPFGPIAMKPSASVLHYGIEVCFDIFLLLLLFLFFSFLLV